MQNLFVYADESGVFDHLHNDYFVFGGLIFLTRDERDAACRRYISVEKILRTRRGSCGELKAAKLSHADRGKIFRSLNPHIKFGVAIHQRHLNPHLFADKKTKQRYLDYAFKRGLKFALQQLIHLKLLDPTQLGHIYVHMDEHTTATNGVYELKDSLQTEFKHGMLHPLTGYYFPPIFPHMSGVDVRFQNSENCTLIRAADIVANRLFHLTCTGKRSDKIYSLILPERPYTPPNS